MMTIISLSLSGGKPGKHDSQGYFVDIIYCWLNTGYAILLTTGFLILMINIPREVIKIAGYSNYQTASGGGCTFRAPNGAVAPQDEKLHFHET